MRARERRTYRDRERENGQVFQRRNKISSPAQEGMTPVSTTEIKKSSFPINFYGQPALSEDNRLQHKGHNSFSAAQTSKPINALGVREECGEG